MRPTIHGIRKLKKKKKKKKKKKIAENVAPRPVPADLSS